MKTIVLTVLLFFPTLAMATNVGLVQGLWFSNEQLVEGKPTDIHVAVFNQHDTLLSGEVVFSVDEEVIDTTPVVIQPGQLDSRFITWTPEAGEVVIQARLQSDDELVATRTLASTKITVDRDTDGDGIGNVRDEDDDNDGVSDAEERSRGTDSLDPDDTPEETAAETGREGREGLEQFTTPSYADTALSEVTNWSSTARETLSDHYAERVLSASDSRPTTTVSTSTAPSGSVGEIERYTTPQDSWWTTVVDFFTALYLVLLQVLIWFFTYPMLLQLALLLVLLFSIFKIAKRLGARQ